MRIYVACLLSAPVIGQHSKFALLGGLVQFNLAYTYLAANVHTLGFFNGINSFILPNISHFA